MRLANLTLTALYLPFPFILLLSWSSVVMLFLPSLSLSSLLEVILVIWRKFIFWLFEHTLKFALALYRHIEIGDKVCFVCLDNPDEPQVVFDFGAFSDAFFEEDD